MLTPSCYLHAFFLSIDMADLTPYVWLVCILSLRKTHVIYLLLNLRFILSFRICDSYSQLLCFFIFIIMIVWKIWKMSLLKYFGKWNLINGMKPIHPVFKLLLFWKSETWWRVPMLCLHHHHKRTVANVYIRPLRRESSLTPKVALVWMKRSIDVPFLDMLSEYPKATFGKTESSFFSRWFENRVARVYKRGGRMLLFSPQSLHPQWMAIFYQRVSKLEVSFSGWSEAKGICNPCTLKVPCRRNVALGEHRMKEITGLTVNTLVLTRVPEQRSWLKALFHAMRDLIVNGLPFRGDNENSDFTSERCGELSLNTFKDLIFFIQPELKKITEKLPGNANYTAPQFQNEVIQVL